MTKSYDNWGKLVEKAIRREHDKELSLCDSLSSGNTSSSSISNSSSQTQGTIYSLTLHDQETISPSSPKDIILISRPTIYLDEMTGKKCFMLGARELKISCADFPQCWKWTSHADSRFPEVAKLEEVWWLDIRGTIGMQILSPNTTYAAFLVFKLDEDSYGLESAKATTKYVDVQLDEVAEKHALIVHLQHVEDREGEIAVNRIDGWMEVEIGKLYSKEGDDGEVEARLFEMSCLKKGLIVEGIEFRPSYDESSSVLVEHVVSKKKRKRKFIGSSLRHSLKSPGKLFGKNI